MVNPDRAPLWLADGAWATRNFRTSEVPSARCSDPVVGSHCAHLTGPSVTNGLAIAGAAEVKCCWCGERVDAQWHAAEIGIENHGPHGPTRPAPIYALPPGWRLYEETE